MLAELKFYPFSGSPASRRVQIFMAEKGLGRKLVSGGLGAGELSSQECGAFSAAQTVPTLRLDDGTVIVEVPSIWRYVEETYPTNPLLGETSKERALVDMWVGRAELDGFAAVVESEREAAQNGRPSAAEDGHWSDPALIERSRVRALNFISDLDTQLASTPFVAGDRFTAADITALVTIDFAAEAFALSVPDENLALKRWYRAVSGRPSVSARAGLCPHRTRISEAVGARLFRVGLYLRKRS